jgi:hypothetical protein
MQDQNGSSKLKSFFKELGFFLAVVLAVVLTVVDIFLGLARYAFKRASGHSNFNPWEQTCNFWIMVGRHLRYLFRMLSSDFRAQVRAQRVAMHRAASAFHGSMAGAKAELADFDYVDAVVFFAYLPSLLGYGFLLVHAVIATITMISVYGVYVRHDVAKPRTTPEAEVVVPYVPQVADQQEQNFKPWFDRGQVFDRVNHPDFLNIALISDTGSVKYSQTKVADPAGFVPTSFHERVVNPRVTETGQITFHDQSGRNYVVNKGQGFMFEGYASKMFMFDANGKLTTITQSDVKTR